MKKNKWKDIYIKKSVLMVNSNSHKLQH